MNLRDKFSIKVETYDEENNNKLENVREYSYDHSYVQLTNKFPHPFLSWIKGVFISEGFHPDTVNKFFTKERE